MDKADSDFLCLQALVQDAKLNPQHVGWYIYQAFRLGSGCTVDEALKPPPSLYSAAKPTLKLVPPCKSLT